MPCCKELRMVKEERRLPLHFIDGIVCFFLSRQNKGFKKKRLCWIGLVVGLDLWVKIGLEQKLYMK